MGEVVAMAPEWPRVRCQRCGLVYRQPGEFSGPYAPCPRCGHEKWSTQIGAATMSVELGGAA